MQNQGKTRTQLSRPTCAVQFGQRSSRKIPFLRAGNFICKILVPRFKTVYQFQTFYLSVRNGSSFRLALFFLKIGKAISKRKLSVRGEREAEEEGKAKEFGLRVGWTARVIWGRRGKLSVCAGATVETQLGLREAVRTALLGVERSGWFGRTSWDGLLAFLAVL